MPALTQFASKYAQENKRLVDTLACTVGCTPLINRVRPNLAWQCFERDDRADTNGLSKCQKMLKMELMQSFFVLDVIYW